MYAHTRMMCRELVRDPRFHELNGIQRTELFLAALLHDVDKIVTTRQENGKWVSPHHASAGSHLVRTFLWKDGGLSGTPRALEIRETVCGLIRFHMLPMHLTGQDHPELILRRTAALGEAAGDFSWDLLCMLAEADLRGRSAQDADDALALVQLARLMAQEAGCLHGPYPFADPYTGHAYLSGRKVQPSQSLYDDTWGEVILLSGLPGTGKDTWIREHCPGMPAVSLDGIRAEMKVKPTEDQGEVLRTARERAREYLRRRQPFVWNATNLTRDLRQKRIRLFEQYGARVRIVYLETEWAAGIGRNLARKAAVPESTVERMLETTEPPTPDEAQTVEWVCV